MRIPSLVLCTALLSTTAVAQIPTVQPAVSKFTTSATTTPEFVPVPFPQLSGATLGLPNHLLQIETRLISGTLYRLALTTRDLPAPLGGVQLQDVAEGTYDAATQAATVGNLAAAFNGPGNITNLTISENGLTAVAAGTTTALWSTRSATGLAFPTPGGVSGVPGTLRFTKLYTEGTQLKLSWQDGIDIWTGDFNAGVVSNFRRIIRHVTVAGAQQVHSQHPVTEEVPPGSGNWVLHGWIISVQRTGGDSDSYYLPGKSTEQITVHPIRPQLIWNNPSFQQNMTTLGDSGTCFVPTRNPGIPSCIPIIAMNGALFSSANGGTIRLRVLVERSQTDLWSTAIFLGTPVTPPLPLVGIVGNPLGQPGPVVPPGLLGVSPVVALQNPVVLGQGGASYQFSVGGGQIPAGIPIPMQAVGINFSTLNIYLGNTAALEGQ